MNTLRRWLAQIGAFLFDVFAAITGFYYSKKYAAIVKRLGLRQPAETDESRPGLIIIQIDGLAHKHLLQALDKGRVPNIKRMLKRDDVALSQWRCGLPGTTPAAQAGIMFGENDDIPAFRWYDKLKRRSMVFKLPGMAAAYQSRLELQRPGILVGGSSYVNVFDGGAYNSLFTMSAIEPRSFFEGVRGAGLVALFLLNPVRFLRIIYLGLKEYITDGAQRLSSHLKGQSYLPFIGLFPLWRILNNVVVHELETFGVLVDIYRGVPAIYVTYYGYDEIAHHFGVDSVAAGQGLRHIDQSIGQIDRLRRANLSRPYALFLLGDHGLTAAEPFGDRYGHTLGQYIAGQLDSRFALVELGEGEHEHLYQTRLLLDELGAIEGNLPPPAAKVAHRIRALVERRLALNNNEMPEWDVQRQDDVVVKNSGSVAHVYFNITNRRMDLSEISAAFPGLVVQLLAHEGIWLVVAREGEQILIMDEDSILTSDADGQQHMEGDHPLVRLPEPQHAAEQILRVARFAQSGDLVLVGSYDPDEDTVICFESQYASHGGLGGPQDYPFIIFPRHLNWDLSLVQNSRDLYSFFASQRTLDPARESQTGEQP
jgi:hypothetical protein